MNIKKRLAFVFALSALMLASCSNDEALVEGAVDGGQKIRMTVTAQREGAGANSRTSLADNNTGKLDCVWTEGDRLIVTNAEGKIKGYLDLISGAGEGFASFSGDLYGVRDGEAVFNYYYLGTKNNATALEDVPNPYTVDYSNQAGTLESLSEYDVMTATATVNVNKGNAPVENIQLARRISFARFQVNLPENATVKHPCQVTLSGEQLANSLSLNMQTREVTTTKGDVTVTTSAEGDFYMTYLPTASPYTLTFTATDGTNTYEGEYTVKSIIGENVYFRKKLENADGVEYVGIPVNMQEAKQYRVFYHINITDINTGANAVESGDKCVCTSKPDIVSGAEAAAYRVLNFTEPELDETAERVNDADFKDGYLYEFLGWGTEKSANTSWASDDLGLKYYADRTIDLATVETKKTEVGETTYYDLHLYAKGSVMQYVLTCVYGEEGENTAWGGSGENRMTGWCTIKLTGNFTKPKPSKFIGWSRRDKNKKLLDEENPIQWDSYVRIDKNDPCAEWDPDFTATSEHPVTGYPRKIKGQLTLKLYPVFKEIPPVSLPGYEGGELE